MLSLINASLVYHNHAWHDWFAVLSPYLFNIMAELLIRIAPDGFEDGFEINHVAEVKARKLDLRN